MSSESILALVREFYQGWRETPLQLRDSSFEANIFRLTMGRRAGHSTAARELVLRYNAHLLVSERTLRHYRGVEPNDEVFKHITVIPQDIIWAMPNISSVPNVDMIILDEFLISSDQLVILRNRIPYLKNFCFILLGCF